MLSGVEQGTIACEAVFKYKYILISYRHMGFSTLMQFQHLITVPSKYGALLEPKVRGSNPADIEGVLHDRSSGRDSGRPNDKTMKIYIQ